MKQIISDIMIYSVNARVITSCEPGEVCISNLHYPYEDGTIGIYEYVTWYYEDNIEIAHREAIKLFKGA